MVSIISNVLQKVSQNIDPIINFTNSIITDITDMVHQSAILYCYLMPSCYDNAIIFSLEYNKYKYFV